MQHAFDISIRIVESGDDYEAMFAAALRTADSLHDTLDYTVAHVVVRRGDGEFLGGPDGVFCQGCDSYSIPGVRWPISRDTHEYVERCDTHEWVERCDTCRRYESDDAAHLAVIERYKDSGATVHAGLKNGWLFVDVK